MFLILLQTVTIIPELTLVFIHLLIFLFVLISLNYLIFKPVFKIFNKRKELTETTNIKIVVISGLSDVGLTKALSLGADVALSKPFDNTHLRDVVNKLLT